MHANAKRSRGLCRRGLQEEEEEEEEEKEEKEKRKKEVRGGGGGGFQGFWQWSVVLERE